MTTEKDRNKDRKKNIESGTNFFQRKCKGTQRNKITDKGMSEYPMTRITKE